MLKSVCLLSVLACAPCAQAGELTERVDDGTLITTEFAEKAAQ